MSNKTHKTRTRRKSKYMTRKSKGVTLHFSYMLKEINQTFTLPQKKQEEEDRLLRTQSSLFTRSIQGSRQIDSHFLFHCERKKSESSSTLNIISVEH